MKTSYTNHIHSHIDEVCAAITSVSAYETLAAKNVAALKAICKDYEITGYSRLRKAELIESIRSFEAGALRLQEAWRQDEREEQERLATIATLEELIAAGLAYIVVFVVTRINTRWNFVETDADYIAVKAETWADMDAWMRETIAFYDELYADGDYEYSHRLLTADEAIAALEDENIVKHMYVNDAEHVEQQTLAIDVEAIAPIETTEAEAITTEAEAETTTEQHIGMTEYLVTYSIGDVISTNIAWAVTEEDVRRHYGPILSTCELASTCSWAHDKKYPVVVCEHWHTEVEETTEAKSAAETLDETITEHSGKTNHDMVLAYEQSMRKAIARIVASNINIDGIDDLYGAHGDLREAVIAARNILRICKADEAIADQAVRDFVAQAIDTTDTTDQQVAADAAIAPKSTSVKADEEMIISEEPTETTTETEQPSAAAVIAAIILAATTIIEHIAGIALTGSPKQVAWATDIRAGWLNLVAQTLRSALNDAIAEHDIVQAAYAAEASAKSLANIAGCTSARSIIDARYVDTVYELQHKALNKADEDVRQTLLDAAKNATEADIAAVLDQPKSEADILAEKLEAVGGNRWTKGTNDRVYVDVTLLGATIEHYKTGNVSNATWCGESVSNADGRRLEATKVYVDLSNGELNIITNFSSYSLPSVEEQAQAWYNAALRDGEPTDPEPTKDEATDADAEEMIISGTTTTEGSDCYFTTDELAALEAAGFRRWQRNGLDRLYYSGDCFEAGIYAIYSDAEAKVYVDATDGEMHVEAHPRCIEGHVLDHVGRIYRDALIGVRAEASTTTEAGTGQPTELAEAIAATISGIADHEQVNLWLDASDRNALSVWEQCAYDIAYAASEGCASEVAEETIENARRIYDAISAAWTRTAPYSILYDELHAEVSEMALWLDAIETLESDGEPMTTENVIKAMRGDDDEPNGPDDDPTTAEANDGIDYEAEWRAKHPHTTCATVWVPCYGAVPAMAAHSLPIGITTICTGGMTETVIGKATSKSGKTVTLTVRDESGTTHTRRRNADTMVAVRGYRINRSMWHIDWPTENEDEADTFTDAEAETTDQPSTSHASDHTNVATRIMDLWDDFDPHTYGDCCADNGIEEVRFELEHDPAQMLGLLNDVIEEGTTEQATRAMAIIDAIERLGGDEVEEINYDHNHDKKEASMPPMPTIRLTGGIIKGKRHISEAHKSGKPYDTPTDERGIVTLDGETYERTVYERRTWYNMRPHKLLARYVIIDNVNYEVMSRRNAAYDRWTAERDEDGLFTGVYDFEDGKSWMSCLGDVYVLHSEADGEEYRTDFRDDYPDTGDESVFTAACDFLDKMATGWRPANWRK